MLRAQRQGGTYHQGKAGEFAEEHHERVFFRGGFVPGKTLVRCCERKTVFWVFKEVEGLVPSTRNYIDIGSGCCGQPEAKEVVKLRITERPKDVLGAKKSKNQASA